jgi:hypothetical protein
MRGEIWLVVLAYGACGDAFPVREFDCAALAEAYAAGCSEHLGISSETAACEAVRDGQTGPLAPTIARAADVCEEAAMDPTAPASCPAIFVCADDEHGLTALTRSVQVRGTATVEGEVFNLDTTAGWGWIGTTTGGNAGDFEVLFAAAGRPWYFRLDDFAARAQTRPFVVDAGRPIKLENWEDNLELAAGTVVVEAFALDGAFEIAASGSDPMTGEAIAARFTGSFAE